MRIAILSPYGAMTAEAGLVQLLANCFRDGSGGFTQLLCNGVFSLCDKDEESGWNRSLITCSACMGEQRSLAEWSGIKTLELSKYMNAEDTLETKLWVAGIKPEDLSRAEFRGHQIFSIIANSFSRKFGTENFEFSNKKQEPTVRRFLLAASRMICATNIFHATWKPDLCIVANGQDYITKSFVDTTRNLGNKVSVVKFELSSRSLSISHPERSATTSSDIVIGEFDQLPNSIAQWPQNIREQVERVGEYIGLSNAQLPLL